MCAAMAKQHLVKVRVVVCGPRVRSRVAIQFALVATIVVAEARQLAMVVLGIAQNHAVVRAVADVLQPPVFLDLLKEIHVCRPFVYRPASERLC